MSFRVESDYKTRIDIQIQTHVRSLISLMTEFDETDENFGIAFAYMMSNIKNHRFLSVDKFRVKRELNGLEEKFEIHLQQKKAVSLRKLVDRFMDRKLKPHVADIHYSILQFLLLMSNNPISAHLEEDSFGMKYLSNDDKPNKAENQLESTKMIDERFSFNNNINFIIKQQQEELKKYDDDYVFESSSDEDEFDDEEEEEEIEEQSDKIGYKINQEESNLFRKGIDVFGLENSSQKKEGIIKNKINQNNIAAIGDKPVDQSKIVSFKDLNDSKFGYKKDSILQVTIMNQNQGDLSVKNQNENQSSAILGGMQTNQSFWNITQQSILKKSSLQRRSYEEFLSEQKNEEERQLFLSTRYFTKNDIFRDPNSLAQIYENYIKETLNRNPTNQSNQPRELQLSLNHWIYQNKTERQIIQDIIIMLQGQPSSTFILVGEYPPEFKLKKKIQVNHLTPSTLENMVDNCIDFANQLLKFQFYREQYSKIEIGTSFQAFLASIQAFYLQFQNYINAFHLVFLHQSAQIQKKEIEVTLEERYEFMLQKTISLMELFRGMRDYQMEMKMMVNMLDGVIEIFKKTNSSSNIMELMSGNISNRNDMSQINQNEDQNNVQGYIACQIIDFLYYQLQIDSQQYCSHSDLQQLNSQLFLLSIEPYIAILNDWLHGGFFFDKFSEFFIKNNISNQNQQHTQQNYQHIDHKINWVKDFSIRYHQEPDSISKTVTPSFLKKHEQTILQIGKNVRLIGYILNEHNSRIVVEKLKIEDIRDSIKNQISEAIEKIKQSLSSTTADQDSHKTIQNSSSQAQVTLNLNQQNQSIINQSSELKKEGNIKKQQDQNVKIGKQPQKFLKNVCISSILKQKNLMNDKVKVKETFQLKEEFNFEDKSLHQSVIIDEQAMQVEQDNLKNNPFNIFTLNHSEIFNQSVFSLQDSFLNKIIPDLQIYYLLIIKKLNTQATKIKKNEEVNMNKKINELIDKEGFTSQFLRLFDLSIDHTLTSMDKQVKQYLGSILMNKFKLLEHFQALRHIYFMENGHISTEFLNYLFDNLETYDTLKNASSLKNYFKELITNSNQACIKNLSDHFSIEIQQDPINTYLKNLKIKFEAPYPLDAIFDQDSIFLYNHIFQFLVQLKKSSHFLLEKNYYLKKMKFFDDSRLKNKLNLINKSRKEKKNKKLNSSFSDEDEFNRSSEMEVEEDKEEQQRLSKQTKRIKWQMCLLQKNFLNFTNSFQYSTFVIIIEEMTKEFLKEISKEFNIAMFIEIHKQYLKKIADLCFLSKKTENIFSIISSMLKYCCDFHALIQRLEATETLDQYTMKGELNRIQHDFDSLQMNFNRHNQFILNFLLKYEDKGLKQEWVPLSQALDFNNFYIPEDELKRIKIN